MLYCGTNPRHEGVVPREIGQEVRQWGWRCHILTGQDNEGPACFRPRKIISPKRREQSQERRGGEVATERALTAEADAAGWGKQGVGAVAEVLDEAQAEAGAGQEKVATGGVGKRERIAGKECDGLFAGDFHTGEC